jgi:phage-related minor tail protein
MREESLSALTAKEEQLKTIRRRVEESSALVRDFKRMLRSDAQAPSVAAVREELQLEQRLETMAKAQQVFDGLLAKFADMAKRWTTIQSRLKEIKSSGLSVEDSARLTQLKKFYLEQLRDYGFSSYELNEISLSPESYRPTVNGYEMGLTSASDAIRSIWAYLLGMLEVARTCKTNHIGFIVFDEPKQQSAADLSFAALLKRAANAKANAQQVIFSTSEKRERLDEMLKHLDCTYIKFDSNMLTTMPN